MTTCLLIPLLAGMTCAIAPPPPATQCQAMSTELLICHVDDATSLPARLSWYNPLHQPDALNCQQPCNRMADGTLVVDCGHCIACPLGMYGMWVEFEPLGARQCRDHGGAIAVRHGRYYTPEGFVTGWFVAFDLPSLDGKVPDGAYWSGAWEVTG